MDDVFKALADPSRRKLLDELFEKEQILAPVGNPKNRLQEATLHPEPIALAKVQKALRPDEMVLEYVLDEPKSFCLHITRSGAGVSSGNRGGSEVRMACAMSNDDSPANGALPESISWRIAPNANTSERASAGRPRTCSGDM